MIGAASGQQGANNRLNAFLATAGPHTLTGTASEPQPFASAAIARFNADAPADVLAGKVNVGPGPHVTTGQINVYIGDGIGNLNPTTTVLADGDAYGLVAGDWDGDGDNDAMTANYGIRNDFPDTGRYPSAMNWLENTPSGFVVRPIIPDAGFTAPSFGLRVAELNGDGKPDFLHYGIEVNAYLSYDDANPPEASLGGGGGGDRAAVERKGKKLTFKFKANEKGASFTCKLGKKPATECRSPYKVKKPKKAGKYKFKVRATDLANNTGKPARKKFTVR